MPSTPYAASAADTPIASAKRPKRRAQQPLTSPSRRSPLCTDRDEDKGGSASEESAKQSSRKADLAGEGGGDQGEDEVPEAPSPPKARKGSISSTPRSSGICTDASTAGGEAKGRSSVGGGGAGEGAGAESREDQNRHKPKESSIFSPALKPDSQTPEKARDQAPTSTVGVPPDLEGGRAATGDDDSKAPPTAPPAAVAAAAAAAAAASIGGEHGAKARGANAHTEGKERGVGGGEDAVASEGQSTEPCGKGEGGEGVGAKAGGDGGDGTPGLTVREGGGERQEEANGVVGVEGAGGVEEEEEEEEEFNPYCFIAHLPPYNTVKHHTPEAPALPEKRKTRHGKELTLVLDLDETLVHCTVDPIANPDHRFEVHFNGEEFQVYVRKRPHLDVFLEAVAELFEVVVFTASQQVYAERLLNMIDPQKKFVKYRLYRDACMTFEGNYLKDLNVLGRDLSKVAIVDNSPYAYGFQIDNGIPIESWFDDTADEELLHLLPLLKQLISESESAGGDVRPFIRNIFKTHELVNKARNGERDIGSPLHYPVTVSPEEAEKARGAGAATAAGGAVSSAPPEEEGAAKE